MSKKLKDLKKKTRTAARGGRNGQIFERFVNAHNARMTEAAGIQTQTVAMEESGIRKATGRREA